MCWQHLVIILTCAVFSTKAWFEACNKVVDLKVGYSQTISSVGYPRYGYRPKSSCRYIIRAPGEYQVLAKCYIDLVGEPGKCLDERFYIGAGGNPDINTAHFYCGKVKEKKAYSTGNQMNIAYISKRYSGQFRCTLTAVCDCGWGVNSRIVGGTDAQPNQYPSMAALYSKQSKYFFCGATIISSKYALSAAHCLGKYPAANVEVVAGLYEKGHETSYTKYYQVAHIIINRAYKKGHDYDDIGLVKIVGSFVWSKLVSPACLPFLYETYNFAGRIVQATGWGTTEFGGHTDNKLQTVDLNVISNGNCNAFYGNINATQLCTSSKPINNVYRDACQYDSGGPLWYRGPTDKRLFNIGIISLGEGCGSRKPSINTRTTSYLRWIESITGPLCHRSIK